MNHEVRNILKKYQINITKTRLLMLNTFLESGEPLTQNHFIGDSVLALDRTSIFRTLKLFARKKIIHRVPSTDGITRYLLQQASATVHTSFICSSCRKVVPLKTLVLPEVELPKDFMQQNMEIVIDGLCNACRASR